MIKDPTLLLACIPYYVTSPIIRRCSTLKTRKTHCLTDAEVLDRLLLSRGKYTFLCPAVTDFAAFSQIMIKSLHPASKEVGGLSHTSATQNPIVDGFSNLLSNACQP